MVKEVLKTRLEDTKVYVGIKHMESVVLMSKVNPNK